MMAQIYPILVLNFEREASLPFIVVMWHFTPLYFSHYKHNIYINIQYYVLTFIIECNSLICMDFFKSGAPVQLFAPVDRTCWVAVGRVALQLQVIPDIRCVGECFLYSFEGYEF